MDEMSLQLHAYIASDELKADVRQAIDDYEAQGLLVPPRSEIRQSLIDTYRTQLERNRAEELLGGDFILEGW